MKKIMAVIAFLIAFVIFVTGCVGSTRSREGLPQVTRLDRGIVAAESARVAAALEAEAVARADAGSGANAGAGTGSGASGEGAASTTFHTDDDGVITFHLSNQTAPTHPIHLGLLRFKEEVETRSGGGLIVELHHSGAIGGDAVNLDLIISNRLDASLITTWGLWHTHDEMANFESLPFLFSNYEEAWAAYEGTLGEWVTRNVIEPSGAMVLGYWTNGLRHFTNNVRPIYTPDDLRGLNMRSMQMPTHLAMYEAFDAASMGMPFDQLYAAMESGAVDGQDNPLGNIHASRLFEVQQYLSISNHMYSSAILVVSTDFWGHLSEEHQQTLLDSSIVASRYQGELTRFMEEEQLREIEEFGTQINHVNIEPFATAVEFIWEDHIGRFGNEFVTIASRYISDPDALAHRFSE